MKGPLLVRAVGPMLAVAWIASAGTLTAVAQEALPPFNRVEEDWVLVINQTDLPVEGPQITTTMSPKPGLTGRFVEFNVNYRSQPSFQGGGLEVVGYNVDQVLATSTQHSAKFSTAGEQITWTQSLGLSAGTLTYEVKNGQSTTWDKFGQGSGANLNVLIPTSLSTLSGYSPESSVNFSGVGWQANHVQEMKLVRVRYYQGGQLVAVDETVRNVELGQ